MESYFDEQAVVLHYNEQKVSNHTKKRKESLFDTLFKNKPGISTYVNILESIKHKINTLYNGLCETIFDDIVNCLQTSHDLKNNQWCFSIVPCVVLLTDTYQYDNVKQFEMLLEKIRLNVTPHVAMVQPQGALTSKNMMNDIINDVVWQLIKHNDSDDYDDDCIAKTNSDRKKYNMTMLKNWYNEKYLNNTLTRKSIVIAIPNFESFKSNVLEDLIMVLSCYISFLPLVIVLGMPTSDRVPQDFFSYQVMRKLKFNVFRSHSHEKLMDMVLEEVFLTDKCPFYLSGETLQMISDVFSSHDFSMTSLSRSIESFLSEHYYGDNLKTLCCNVENLEEAVRKLNKKDLEEARHLMSFRPYCEGKHCREQVDLLLDDEYFRKDLYKELVKLHDHTCTFYLAVKLLSVFVKQSPQNLIGRSVREIYQKCVSEDVTNTDAFRKCFQLITFQSKSKLLENINGALNVINSFATHKEKSDRIQNLERELGTFKRQIAFATNDAVLKPKNMNKLIEIQKYRSPNEQKPSKEEGDEAAVKVELEEVRWRVMTCLAEFSSDALRPPSAFAFHELYKLRPIGANRLLRPASRWHVHAALVNPVQYLQCKCCSLPTADTILSSLPDESILYKLVLECGLHINLYDLMQSFHSILYPSTSDDDQEDIDSNPNIRRRFIHALDTLRLFGFIKPWKYKAGHVMRLTY